jgi:hypothetical protein
MKDRDTGKANNLGAAQSASAIPVPADKLTAAAQAQLKRSRIREVKLQLEGDDRNAFHLRDHSLHLGDDTLPLSGTDGRRPLGTIAKG